MNYTQHANILVQALPYIQEYYGKTIVIKYGGNAMINDNLTQTVINDIILMKCIGINPIIVHGGGPDISNTLTKMNHESKFINGLRYTDETTINVAQMVLAGKVNKDLVKLIENNYFNAIFTTNFDDLLNEAFYRFSNVRPVVCAHDSAITSITVTSKRPKIIKLHGDYLFEDIKSTLRETESLEGNMKNKFIEFSKDYGLIVVGYAGNDRSIMDILSFLLKKEEFFKNGIYWCIRKGDENISDDLKKLLWKDKVFFIQIEGFDELMAELNKRLNKGVLPIDNAILSSEHQIKLIKSLTSNEYVEKSNSKIIQEDSKRLKKMVNHNIFEDFFKHVDVKKEKKDNTTRKDSSSKISEEEKKL